MRGLSYKWRQENRDRLCGAPYTSNGYPCEQLAGPSGRCAYHDPAQQARIDAMRRRQMWRRRHGWDERTKSLPPMNARQARYVRAVCDVLGWNRVAHHLTDDWLPDRVPVTCCLRCGGTGWIVVRVEREEMVRGVRRIWRVWNLCACGTWARMTTVQPSGDDPPITGAA